MGPALLIMVREGFEAALIVSIVYAYLRKIGRRDLGGAVWTGVLAAAAISVAVGVVIRISIGTLEGDARLISFAVVSLAAAIVLTWMVFWMRRQSRLIKNELEEKVDDAILGGNVRKAVAGVAFLAVLREGIESALFLIAAATADDGTRVAMGAVIGLAIASALGYAVYRGGSRLPMRTFFRVTGMVIVVFAAGLLARTVLFLQSADVLGTVADNVYDVTGARWLTQQTEVGKFLAAMFGWDPRPSIEQVIVWAAYIVPVSWLFLRNPKPTVPAPATVAVAQSESVKAPAVPVDVAAS